MNDADDKTSSLLAALWLRNLPLVEGLREEASHTAHKLAGSLGMYGYDEGTRIAREIEVLLAGDGTRDAARFGNLVAELQRAVFPEA
jgi:HPt (histidine-containing phosphotransfer) domain-containing protein